MSEHAWDLVARMAFWRCRSYSRRDRALAWVYGRLRRRHPFRRAVLRLGSKQSAARQAQMERIVKGLLLLAESPSPAPSPGSSPLPPPSPEPRPPTPV